MQMASVDLNVDGNLQPVTVPRLVGLRISDPMGTSSMVSWHQAKKEKKWSQPKKPQMLEISWQIHCIRERQTPQMKMKSGPNSNMF